MAEILRIAQIEHLTDGSASPNIPTGRASWSGPAVLDQYLKNLKNLKKLKKQKIEKK